MRPNASVTTTCALPVPLMPGCAASWKGPTGTWPLYWRRPSTYSSTVEGTTAWPRKLGVGVSTR